MNKWQQSTDDRRRADSVKLLLFLLSTLPFTIIGAVFVQAGVHDAAIVQAQGIKVYGSRLFTSAPVGHPYDNLRLVPFHAGLAQYAWLIAMVAAGVLAVTGWAWWQDRRRIGLIAAAIATGMLSLLLLADHTIYSASVVSCFGTRFDPCLINTEPMGDHAVKGLFMLLVATGALSLAMVHFARRPATCGTRAAVQGPSVGEEYARL